MKTYIGIDNGLDGGIAVLHGSNAPIVGSMPTIRLENKRVYDEKGIRKVFDLHCGVDDFVVIIERAQSMPKQGSVSMFNYGTGYGLIRGICVGMCVPYVLVHPRTWQRVMFAGLSRRDTKSQSVLVAQRMFPLIDLRATQRSKKPHDGMSDALLIAAYGRRMGL